jgi:hypothetical protein
LHLRSNPPIRHQRQKWAHTGEGALVAALGNGHRNIQAFRTAQCGVYHPDMSPPELQEQANDQPGKTGRTVTQLKAYREFGSPEVSLLDCYVCETGFVNRNPFPPPTLRATLTEKMAVLERERFGYQLLPFEHDRNTDGDFGLKFYANRSNPMQRTFNLVPAISAQPEQPFSRLADRLSDFFENLGERPRKNFHQIVFCRECHGLQLIDAQTDYCCPACASDLVKQ